MSYENWKIKKSELEEKQEEYSAVADWCNELGEYHIEEIDDEYCVVKNPEPLPPTTEEIRQRRELYYKENCDPLTCEKIRKTSMGKWTEEDEAEYVNRMNDISAFVNQMYPYPEE